MNQKKGICRPETSDLWPNTYLYNKILLKGITIMISFFLQEFR